MSFTSSVRNSENNQQKLDSAHILSLARNCGADSVGIARAELVEEEAIARYENFVAEGRHAGMDWMAHNIEVRNDPRLLLEGAKSLIVCLFNYHSEGAQAVGAPYVARYALGRDYHKVLRRQVRPLVEALATAGYTSRICVDSAPLRERYWASRSGAAIIGLNHHLIVPGRGSAFLVATIVTTAELQPSESLCQEAYIGKIACERCGRCIKACPGGALRADGTFDACRCLSYLTIEASDDVSLPQLKQKYAFGCDACRLACPHSQNDRPTSIADFVPRRAILDMTFDQWRELTHDTYNANFNGTPIRRASLARLLRNLE